MNPYRDCDDCQSAFCCVVVCMSQLQLPLFDHIPVEVAAMISRCWREGHHGDKDVDRERVDVVYVYKVL